LEHTADLELNYQRFARLLEFAHSVSFRDEPSVLFQDLAPRLRRIVPFDFINFGLYSAPAETIKMFMWDGEVWPAEPMEVSLDEAAVGWVWKNQSTLYINDLLEENRFETGLRCVRGRDLRSYCVLPLTTPQEKIGALGFGSKRVSAFNPHDQFFLKRVAEMIALCMDRSLAEVALSLAPLVSPSRVAPSIPAGVRPEENETFSQRDFELLRQIAASLVPLVERARSVRQLDSHLRQGVGSVYLGGPEAPAGLASLKAHSVSAPSGGVREPPSEAPHDLSLADSLREWEQLLTLYANASQVGLCIMDTDLRYRIINQALAKMNGYPVQAHLGRTVREILGPCSDVVEANLRSALSTGQPILDLALSFQLPGKTEPGHWVANYLPIKDVFGQVCQIGVVVVETTQQKKLENSLRHVSECLKAERKRTQVMTEVSRLLGAKLDMRQVFPQISAYLRRLLRQEYAALSLRNEKSGALVLRALDFPLQKNLSARIDAIAPEDPTVTALRQNTSLIVTHEEMKQSHSPATKYLLSEGLQSLCCVPILRPKNPLGVLVLGSTRASAFTPNDLILLDQVSAQLAIALENDLASRQIDQLRNRLDQEKSYLEGESEPPVFAGLVGESPALQHVLKRVSIVAETNATVLLLGETGTGKGLVARALHESSKRKGKNFVTLNCAAIPTGLLESELFGHEKGAFTGAVSQKIGRLELADGGTLFLDEIGEIPSELQPKLLLRERREDIPMLVRHFVRKFSNVMGRTIETIPRETMDALVNWHWPGNVRELENFIERSVILTEGTSLRSPLAELHAEASGTDDFSLEDSERQLIIRVLRQTHGVISGPAGAAQRLNLKRTTLQSKIERLGISPEEYSDGPPN
jgi:formate hydrogenlyase transcriptional activator